MDKRIHRKKAVTRRRTCSDCGAVMNWGRITLHLERGGFYADIENVPAYVCSRCHARVLQGATAEAVSRTVEQLFKDAQRSEWTGVSIQKIAVA